MNDHERMALVLKTMGHPVRLRILEMLRHGEACVCHLEAALGKRQAYISQHLMTLREVGLVQSRKVGLQVYYQIADLTVRALIEALSEAPQSVGIDQIDGCTCPHCTTILTYTID